MANILFIQPGFAHYRRSFFEYLHANHDVCFMFKKGVSTYPSNLGPNPDWYTVKLNCESNRLWMYHLASHIINQKPDVIITSNNGSDQSIIAGLMGRLLKIPVILWSEAWDSDRYKTNKIWWKRVHKYVRTKFTSLAASAFIVSGRKSMDYNKKLAGVKKPLFIAYQSTRDIILDINTENNSFQILKIRFKNVKINILYFSRIIKMKGLDYLIRAFVELEKEFDNIKLNIVGDGAFKSYCENLSIDLKANNIEFIGPIPNEEAWMYYKLNDIFVLPHDGTQIEGWGLVFNEASSMSLPIITTDAAGAAGDLIIDNINGFVVKAGSVDVLKEALRKLIENAPLRKRMGQESRKLFDKINSYERMYEGFDKAVQYVLESK